MKRVLFASMISAALLMPAAFGQRPVREPGRIRQRQAMQQQRIGQGIESGRLTPAEAARLERNEARLNREARRDRADGGGLSLRERRKIETQQDRLSRQIYRQKRDWQGARYR